ncbi:MAG: response regulator [Sideroxydans sp.]|nr:response regulator [Sideroxydans sp.]
MQTKQQTVFIVDDDEDLREALSLLMRSVGLRSETFASAKEFLHRLDPSVSGCLVLDIRMPGMSGMELQAELHNRHIRLPIVFLTGHGDVPRAVAAMKAGAFDFIQKPLEAHRLVISVMNAFRVERGAGSQPEVAAGNAEKLALLSERQMGVMRLLLEGKQNSEIADALCISIKTVEYHRAAIRKKLGVGNLSELFRVVFANQK